MTGPMKASIIIALAVVVLVAVNIRMYRAMKTVTAKGRAAELRDDEVASGSDL